jgi:CHASE1-domain containing sensor protein
MTVQDLARLVADLRKAQKYYFRSQSDSALKEAMRLERRVDETLKFLLSPQRDLFADTEEDKAS